jgi:ferritin
MLDSKLVSALSKQINAEYYSAYLYLVMSASADQMGLKGTANWLFVQAQEEMAHGTRIYEYVLERNELPSFMAIDLPPTSHTDIAEMFKDVLAHEKLVTKSINSIASLAMQESDHACYQFLMWFVNEQVEEEDSANDIIDKLEMIAGDRGMLLTLDNELATRVFVHPFPAPVA